MLSFDSSIQKSAYLKTQPSTDNWKHTKCGHRPTFAKKCKIFLIDDSKRPTCNYFRKVLKPV